MSLAQSLLPELEQELANTRKTLERVPTDQLGWKPHEKSGTFAWMAGHLANLPMWGAMTLTTDELDLSDTPAAPQAESTAWALETFDKNAETFKQALLEAGDDKMLANWKLIYKGQELFNMPRIAVLRSMVINHLIHHRGQLTMYLRLRDIPVPALYGPSADEGQM
ncbi:MAG: damage-inducible protein DinB [Acidobacteria bacterium]|nr:damage-inducible protein DinB [Acidobacteriota bacterium]